ncbi:hypothetical protein RBH26_04685 [Natronolimnohabitans sp. A-GB9]|uniref:hypothetical protein n=1 Tax=Natronolimnohabitans sp. A-GB9 TaxID=3069757 RepID=UPI0027AFA29A|nr:hypothetical protein [Natronolimnohabitans sp. A-GB9]MDQ2049772.1 hypothetical protein [Natronolimnohabitans sp. A-GB9]
MAIRTNGSENSQLGRLRNRIRSTLFGSDEGTDDDAAGEETTHDEPDDHADPNPQAPGNLFQCSTCGTVYIDAEKRVCSECDDDVEQVRSTLESQPSR